MTRGWRFAHVYLPPRATDRYCIVRGPVRDLADRLRIRYRWSPLEQGWEVRQDRVADLEALGQLEGGWTFVVHPCREAA